MKQATHVLWIIRDNPIDTTFAHELLSQCSLQDDHIIQQQQYATAWSWSVKLSPSEATTLRSVLKSQAKVTQTDIVLLDYHQFVTKKKLVAFDMDSTLIQAEVIDEMAKVYGVGEQVKLITAKAMNGELNFDEALRERLMLLKGMKQEAMAKINATLPLTKGAAELIPKLKSQGIKTAIFSGGFEYFVQSLKSRLHMDYAHSNQLDWKDDELTGIIHGKIVNAQRKVELLKELCLQEGIALQDSCTVGDGANDIPMLQAAGLGVGFHAKEKVLQNVPVCLNYCSMDKLSYLLGLGETL